MHQLKKKKSTIPQKKALSMSVRFYGLVPKVLSHHFPHLLNVIKATQGPRRGKIGSIMQKAIR